MDPGQPPAAVTRPRRFRDDPSVQEAEQTNQSPGVRITRLTFSQMEGERQAIRIGFEVDLARKAPARAARSVTVLPPLAPAAET